MRNILMGLLFAAPICITVKYIAGITGWEYWLITGVSLVTTFVARYIPHEETK